MSLCAASNLILLVSIADEFVIYTREPKVPYELEKWFVKTIGQHYNMSLMIKPRQTDCKTRDDNLVRQDRFVFDSAEKQVKVGTDTTNTTM